MAGGVDDVSLPQRRQVGDVRPRGPCFIPVVRHRRQSQHLCPSPALPSDCSHVVHTPQRWSQPQTPTLKTSVPCLPGCSPEPRMLHFVEIMGARGRSTHLLLSGCKRPSSAAHYIPQAWASMRPFAQKTSHHIPFYTLHERFPKD